VGAISAGYAAYKAYKWTEKMKASETSDANKNVVNDALLWHAAHGNSVKCGGFTIPVPIGWWARSSCELVTPSPAYTFRLRQTPVQLFVNLESAPSINDPRWREDVKKRLERDGYSLERTEETTVATAPAFCFEFASPSKRTDSSTIACDVDKKMVVAFFYSDQNFKPKFYEILSSIK